MWAMVEAHWCHNWQYVWSSLYKDYQLPSLTKFVIAYHISTFILNVLWMICWNNQIIDITGPTATIFSGVNFRTHLAPSAHCTSTEQHTQCAASKRLLNKWWKWRHNFALYFRIKDNHKYVRQRNNDDSHELIFCSGWFVFPHFFFIQSSLT